MRTYVNACDFPWRCTDKRVCTVKVDSGRKIPRRTGESNLPQRRAGPTLYQLSYIPPLKSGRVRGPGPDNEVCNLRTVVPRRHDPDRHHSPDGLRSAVGDRDQVMDAVS